MTIDKFLSFWNHYNVHIIEGLVALIIVLALIQAYRIFFSKKSADQDLVSGGGIDAAQLEKTLQKILEAQGGRSAGKAEDMGVDVDLNGLDTKSSGGASDAAAVAELAQLKAVMAERQALIDSLQGQLKEAASGAAAASAPGSGLSASEKAALDDKIRDLEARLSEYEIISEDIADLSKYKEENEALKAQLAAAKAGGDGGSSAPAPAAAAPVTPATPAPAAAAAPVEAPIVEEPVAPVATPEAQASSVETPPADTAAGGDLIDDELMREFAAAVEGQKATTAGGGGESDPAAVDPAAEPAKNSEETEKLMSEFENFVTKKS